MILEHYQCTDLGYSFVTSFVYRLLCESLIFATFLALGFGVGLYAGRLIREYIRYADLIVMLSALCSCLFSAHLADWHITAAQCGCEVFSIERRQLCCVDLSRSYVCDVWWGEWTQWQHCPLCVVSSSTWWSSLPKLRCCIVIRMFSFSLKVFVTIQCFDAVSWAEITVFGLWQKHAAGPRFPFWKIFCEIPSEIWSILERSRVVDHLNTRNTSGNNSSSSSCSK